MWINEIFDSIDGEVNYYGQGMFTTFVRLQGCNLRCSYCDTQKAQTIYPIIFKETSCSGGGPIKMTPSQVFAEVIKHGMSKVTITGGEPLEQRKELLRLLEMFSLKTNLRVTIETNGSKSLRNIFDMASWVVDYKLPSSGMQDAMDIKAFSFLGSEDVVKFVVKDFADFKKAREFIRQTYDSYSPNWGGVPMLAFSPVFGKLDPHVLYKMIVESGLPTYYKIALNIQLHKIIGLP